MHADSFILYQRNVQLLRVILFAAPSLHFAFACLRKSLFYAIFTCMHCLHSIVKTNWCFCFSLSLFSDYLSWKKNYYFFCIFISMFDRWNSTGSGTISINLYIKYETKKKNEFAMKVRAPHFYSFNSCICCAISLFFDYVIFRAKPNRHLIDSHRTNSNSS